MSKGNYQRKLRRIDYSKAEIAEKLNVVETSVDAKIDNLCDAYGLKKGFFKRDGEKGPNFFAPEFTPILVSLLENENDNPNRKTKNKRKELTTEDIVRYNKKMQESIMGNSEIPKYLKEYIKQLPFYRSSIDVVELMDIFVLEMEILIHNLFGTEGTDVGQALRQAIRMIDIANYNMFCGRTGIKYLTGEHNQLQKENEEGLMKELDAMSQEELEEKLQCPSIKAVYEKYKGKLKDEKLYQSIDAKDLSIDQGTLSVIRALMQQCGANALKNGTILDLPEYLDDDQYQTLVSDLAKDGKMNTEEKKIERKQYLDNQEIEILTFLKGCQQSGTMEFINSNEKKWKPIYKLIEDKERVDIRCQRMQTMDFNGQFDQEYYDFCMKIKNEEKELKERVSNFLGRTITDYVFASNKK